MTEVFLSPFLSESDQFHAKNLIKNLYPDATFAPKFSPDITFRIVTPKDIFYTTKMDCLTMTVLCLKQIIEKNISLNDLSADWRVYCNLFLYQKKVVFYKLEEDLLRRCSTMVKCMGGIIIENINAGDIDYVITKEYDEINPTLGILPTWIETLFYETQYVKPIHFYVKGKVSKEKSDLVQKSQERKRSKKRKGKNSPRKSSLKTPVNEMRSIRSDNAGFILRRRDNSQDIRSFLNNPLSQDTKHDANIFDSFDGNQNSANDEKINNDLNKASSCPLMKEIAIPKSPIQVLQNSIQTFSDKCKNEEDEDEDVIIISKEDFFNDKKPSKEAVQTLNPVNERIPLKEKSKSNLNLLSNGIDIISKNPISKNAKLKPVKTKQTKEAKSFITTFSSDDDDDIDHLINSHKQSIIKNSEKNQVYNAIQNINSFNQSFGNVNPENNVRTVDYGFDSNLNSFSQSTQNIQSKNCSSVGYDQSEDLLVTENFSGNDPFLSILSGINS